MKPPEKPRPLNHYEWDEEYKEQLIMNCDLLTNDDASFEDHIEDWKDQNDWQPNDPLPTVDICGYQNDLCTLAELLAKVPADVPPEDIVISINRDRHINYINFAVTAKRPIDKVVQQQARDKAIEEHRKNEEKYLAELAIYEKWKKEQDIRELEEKLATLKNEQPT